MIDEKRFNVVINDEEQYSIWPEKMKIPNGWKIAGMIGTKKECIEFIEKEWIDMRPLSLRKEMENHKLSYND